jgi:hypothetical protein
MSSGWQGSNFHVWGSKSTGHVPASVSQGDTAQQYETVPGSSIGKTLHLEVLPVLLSFILMKGTRCNVQTWKENARAYP